MASALRLARSDAGLDRASRWSRSGIGSSVTRAKATPLASSAEELRDHLDRHVVPHDARSRAKRDSRCAFTSRSSRSSCSRKLLVGADPARRLELDREPVRVLVRDRLEQRAVALLEPDLDEPVGRAATSATKSASLFSK